MVAVVQSGRFSGATFNPLSIAWHSAYWAEDPNWTNPGDGVAVTTWDDASGNSRSVTQGTPANRPTYRASVAALNNRPALDFDGSNDSLGTGSAFTALSGPATKVIVIQLKSTASGQHFFSWNGTGARCDMNVGTGGEWEIYGLTTPASIKGGTVNTSAHLVIATYKTGASIVVDGTTVASTASGSNTPVRSHRIGSYSGGGSNFTNCHIAFAAMYAGDLSAGDRADLLAWSQSYYGTP